MDDPSKPPTDKTGAGAAVALEPVFDAFISYNRNDAIAVKQIAQLLTDKQVKVWLDEWNLVPGDVWQPEIEKTLKKCRTVVVVAGPNGLSPWQREEVRAAIARRVTETSGLVRVIPVLLPKTDRRALEDCAPFLTAATWVQFSESIDDEEQIHRLVCGIRGLEPGPWTNIKADVRRQCYFLIDGTIDQINQAKIEALIEKLRQYSGDASLTLKEIRRGSIVLVIDGTSIGLERLDYLFRTGQLNELLVRESDLQIEIQEIYGAASSPGEAIASA